MGSVGSKRRKRRQARRGAGAPEAHPATRPGGLASPAATSAAADVLPARPAKTSSLTPASFVRYALALAVGAAGSLTFVHFKLPLPWFLGALTFCLVASVAKLPIERPRPLAIPMRAVLGVAIGSAFTPALLDRAGSMAWSLALLVPFMLFVIGLGMVFYERISKFDRATAFFSAVPGGLTDMTTMAEEAGAKPRTVILVQASRILVIVFALPLWLQWHDGLNVSQAFVTRARLADLTPLDALILFSMGLGGWLGARAIGLAGAPIVGPMLVSGLAHAMGFTYAKMPQEILIVAQISVGTMLGCQFRGLTFSEFMNTCVWGIAYAVVLLVITAFCAHWVSQWTGFDPISVLLGFAPGGQTELNLLAFVLGLDVAYVALHHLVRLGVVILGAQLVFKTQKGWRKA